MVAAVGQGTMLPPWFLVPPLALVQSLRSQLGSLGTRVDGRTRRDSSPIIFP